MEVIRRYLQKHAIEDRVPIDDSAATRKVSSEFSFAVTHEVQHYTICDGWVNTWTIRDSNNNSVSHVFATRGDAQAELGKFLREIRSEIASGDRAPDEGYDASEFRIVTIIII